jgi:hypothetical protein
MVMPPKFGESVDALLPYMPDKIDISNNAGKWVAIIQLDFRNEVVSGVHENMASAIAIALIKEEKANRYSCEGKIINFSFLKKVDRKVVDKRYGISFAEFKRMQSGL